MHGYYCKLAWLNSCPFHRQVCYLGLLENVRVRRAGFANRQPYERFAQRWVITSRPTNWQLHFPDLQIGLPVSLTALLIWRQNCGQLNSQSLLEMHELCIYVSFTNQVSLIFVLGVCGACIALQQCNYLISSKAVFWRQSVQLPVSFCSCHNFPITGTRSPASQHGLCTPARPRRQPSLLPEGTKCLKTLPLAIQRSSFVHHELWPF